MKTTIIAKLCFAAGFCVTTQSLDRSLQETRVSNKTILSKLCKLIQLIIWRHSLELPSLKAASLECPFLIG